MRRVFLLTAFCLAAGSISACKPDEVIQTENIPTAGVRFINAVPDTAGAFGFDFRWIDQLENNAHFRMTYRNGPGKADSAVNSTQVQYKPVRAGSRTYRVFLDDTIQSLASSVLAEGTVSLVAGRLYTAIMVGNARSPGANMQVKFFEEVIADPTTGVALRVINATGGPIEVRHYPHLGAPGAVTMTASAYDTSARVVVTTGRWRANVQPAGGGAPILAYDPYLMVGDTAFSTAGPGGRKDIEALPGTRAAGSALTLIVYPPSVPPAVATAANKTPQTTSTTPGLSFVVPAGISVWDRRPPSVVVP